MYSNTLRYKNGLYGKLSLLLVLLSLVIYTSQGSDLPPNGGSWQGYLLGTLGFGLIVWLAWLGVRKRTYKSALGTVQGWTSAHIYLGLSLIVVATLHTAFQFGFNVHTLAYVLMCLVIVSGLYGLYAYNSVPIAMVQNRANKSLAQWLDELDEVDKSARELSGQCPPDVQNTIASAIERSSLGKSFFSQLMARDTSRVVLEGEGRDTVANINQQAVRNYIARRVPNTSRRGEAEKLQSLLSLTGRRSEILRHIRAELSYNAKLKVWLLLHIPLTAALLFGLVVHVFSVFFYW